MTSLRVAFSAALALLFAFVLAMAPTPAQQPDKLLRVGIIGCDTSHVTAFTSLLNDAKAPPELGGVKVVAAFPGGSPDIPESKNRIDKFVDDLKTKYAVEIVDSIDALLAKVDVVLLESVDGRPHLNQVMPVLKAGKPVFIDKPVAGSLADAIKIFQLAKEHKVPCFSSSSLRFSAGTQGLRDNPKVGKVLGCDVFAPCSLEPHHPDLFWYGVHGVEMLYTIMGTGCETVTRVHTPDAELVVGKWQDGRIGTFRGNRKGKGKGEYGAMVFGTEGNATAGKYTGYEPLVKEIVKFFKTGTPPVSAAETIEIFAFMEAADESKRQGGGPVRVADVIAKAKSAK